MGVAKIAGLSRALHLFTVGLSQFYRWHLKKNLQIVNSTIKMEKNGEKSYNRPLSSEPPDSEFIRHSLTNFKLGRNNNNSLCSWKYKQQNHYITNKCQVEFFSFSFFHFKEA